MTGPPSAAAPGPIEPSSLIRAGGQAYASRVLFDGGNDRLNGITFHSFRVPSLVRTKRGTLIAFAEARVSNPLDHGNINLVYRRSADNGATWSGLRVVAEKGFGTWGNPTAVADQNTGKIWLFMSWNAPGKSLKGDRGTKKITRWGERRVLVSSSSDDGYTFSKPKDLTSSLLPGEYVWDAVGPGVGIQTSSGRLIIPALRRNIFSDDGGKTWTYDEIPGGTSEGAIVELPDGELLRNDRPMPASWHKAKRRWVSRGSIEDGFSRFRPDPGLLDSRGQASILRYSDSPSRILFLNAASTSQRCRMRVSVSYDEGRTWPVGRHTHHWLTPTSTCAQDKGGYSSLAKTADNQVGAMIEFIEPPGPSGWHRSIEFHKFNLAWVTAGVREPVTDPSPTGTTAVAGAPCEGDAADCEPRAGGTERSGTWWGAAWSPWRRLLPARA